VKRKLTVLTVLAGLIVSPAVAQDLSTDFGPSEISDGSDLDVTLINRIRLLLSPESTLISSSRFPIEDLNLLRVQV
jgi:hypothetical protein